MSWSEPVVDDGTQRRYEHRDAAVPFELNPTDLLCTNSDVNDEVIVDTCDRIEYKNRIRRKKKHERRNPPYDSGEQMYSDDISSSGVGIMYDEVEAFLDEDNRESKDSVGSSHASSYGRGNDTSGIEGVEDDNDLLAQAERQCVELVTAAEAKANQEKLALRDEICRLQAELEHTREDLGASLVVAMDRMMKTNEIMDDVKSQLEERMTMYTGTSRPEIPTSLVMGEGTPFRGENSNVFSPTAGMSVVRPQHGGCSIVNTTQKMLRSLEQQLLTSVKDMIWMYDMYRVFLCFSYMIVRKCQENVEPGVVVPVVQSPVFSAVTFADFANYCKTKIGSGVSSQQHGEQDFHEVTPEVNGLQWVPATEIERRFIERLIGSCGQVDLSSDDMTEQMSVFAKRLLQGDNHITHSAVEGIPEKCIHVVETYLSECRRELMGAANLCLEQLRVAQEDEVVLREKCRSIILQEEGKLLRSFFKTAIAEEREQQEAEEAAQEEGSSQKTTGGRAEESNISQRTRTTLQPPTVTISADQKVHEALSRALLEAKEERFSFIVQRAQEQAEVRKRVLEGYLARRKEEWSTYVIPGVVDGLFVPIGQFSPPGQQEDAGGQRLDGSAYIRLVERLGELAKMFGTSSSSLTSSPCRLEASSTGKHPLIGRITCSLEELFNRSDVGRKTTATNSPPRLTSPRGGAGKGDRMRSLVSTLLHQKRTKDGKPGNTQGQNAEASSPTSSTVTTPSRFSGPQLSPLLIITPSVIVTLINMLLQAEKFPSTIISKLQQEFETTREELTMKVKQHCEDVVEQAQRDRVINITNVTTVVDIASLEDLSRNTRQKYPSIEDQFQRLFDAKDGHEAEKRAHVLAVEELERKLLRSTREKMELEEELRHTRLRSDHLLRCFAHVEERKLEVNGNTSSSSTSSPAIDEGPTNHASDAQVAAILKTFDEWHVSVLRMRESLYECCVNDHQLLLRRLSQFRNEEFLMDDFPKDCDSENSQEKKVKTSSYGGLAVLGAKQQALASTLIERLEQDNSTQFNLQRSLHAAETQALRDECEERCFNLCTDHESEKNRLRKHYQDEYEERVSELNEMYTRKVSRMQMQLEEKEDALSHNLLIQRKKLRGLEEELQDAYEKKSERLFAHMEEEASALKESLLARERQLEKDKQCAAANYEEKLQIQVREIRGEFHAAVMENQDVCFSHVQRLQDDFCMRRVQEMCEFASLLNEVTCTFKLQEQEEYVTKLRSEHQETLKVVRKTHREEVEAITEQHRKELSEQEAAFTERIKTIKQNEENSMKAVQNVRREQEEMFWKKCELQLEEAQRCVLEGQASLDVLLQTKYITLVELCDGYLQGDQKAAREAFEQEEKQRQDHLRRMYQYHHRIQFRAEYLCWEELAERHLIEKETFNWIFAMKAMHKEKLRNLYLVREIGDGAQQRDRMLENANRLVPIERVREAQEEGHNLLRTAEERSRVLTEEYLTAVSTSMKKWDRMVRSGQEAQETQLDELVNLLLEKSEIHGESCSKVLQQSILAAGNSIRAALQEAREVERRDSLFHNLVVADVMENSTVSPGVESVRISTPASIADRQHLPPPVALQSMLAASEARVTRLFAQTKALLSKSFSFLSERLETAASEADTNTKDLFRNVHLEYGSATTALLRKLENAAAEMTAMKDFVQQISVALETSVSEKEVLQDLVKWAREEVSESARNLFLGKLRTGGKDAKGDGSAADNGYVLVRRSDLREAQLQTYRRSMQQWGSSEF